MGRFVRRGSRIPTPVSSPPPRRQMGGKEGHPGMPGYSGGYYGDRPGDNLDLVNGRVPETEFEQRFAARRRERATEMEKIKRNDPDLGLF